MTLRHAERRCAAACLMPRAAMPLMPPMIRCRCRQPISRQRHADAFDASLMQLR